MPFDLGCDLGLLRPHPLGLGLELVGVAAEVELLLLGAGGVSHAFGGQ